MRKVKCLDLHGTSVEEVLDEFNERRGELGVPDEDIISISAGPPRSQIKISKPTGSVAPSVAVTIFYWSDD